MAFRRPQLSVPLPRSVPEGDEEEQQCHYVTTEAGSSQDGELDHPMAVILNAKTGALEILWIPPSTTF